jgi:hypothetical protein
VAEWRDLDGELDRWAAAGRRAPLWWRDDDAGPDDGRLAGLLGRRRALGVPLALAVVPAWLAAPTVRLLAGDPGSAVLQHGFDHTSHAAPGRRKQELAAEAPAAALDRRLAEGRSVLARAFGAGFHAVMVPPWNRIDDEVAARLAGLGLRGLSTAGPRGAATRHGLALANVHIDIVDWGRRAFAGDGPALAAACDALARCREAGEDGAEPIGLMTHHRMHDAACDAFVERFVAVVRDHPGARWLDAGDVFATAVA